MVFIDVTFQLQKLERGCYAIWHLPGVVVATTLMAMMVKMKEVECGSRPVNLGTTSTRALLALLGRAMTDLRSYLA